jgi:hypothetical protein
LFAPVARELRKARELGTSVGVPGPHGFAVRDGLIRPRKRLRADTAASTASRFNVRDDAYAPLGEAGRSKRNI